MKKRIAMAILIHSFAQPLGAVETGSEILHLDEESHYIRVSQVPSDVKNGDRVCVYHAQLAQPYCQALFRWISQDPVIILPTDILRHFQVGQKLEIKRIYVSDKKNEGPGYIDANSFAQDYQAKIQHTELVRGIEAQESTQPKIPKGLRPPISPEYPAIEEGEFPQIEVPKIRRKREKPAKAAPGETEEVALAIQKSLKDRSKLDLQFTNRPSSNQTEKLEFKADEAQESVPYVPPVPLHQAIDITAFQTIPLVPVETFRGLRYRTITLDSLDRSTLWEQSKAEMKPREGTGLSLNLLQNMTQLVGFGWRYHVYDQTQSRSTYDDLNPALQAQSTTSVTDGAVHAELGRRYTPYDWLSIDHAGGAELWYSELWFRSYLLDTEKDQSTALGFARSRFFFAAARWHGAIRLHYQGWGMILGSMVTVPVWSFKRIFDGSATVSERLSYDTDSNQDLNKSLTHKTAPLGTEVYLGISYQPQRN